LAPLVAYLRKLHHFAGVKLYVNIAGMILISLLEGVGILLLVPALGFIGLMDAGAETVPFVSDLVKPLQALPERMRLPALLLFFVLLIAGQALLQRKQMDLNVEIQQGFIRRLRLEMYQALLHADWNFFLRKRKSDFSHVMTTELSRVGAGTHLCLRLVTTLLFTAIQIGLALWLSAPLTALVLVCGLGLAVYAKKYIRQSKRLGDETSGLAQEYIAGMTEHFSGMKDIKGNMTERQHWAWFTELCRQMEQNFVQFGKMQSASQYIYKLASAVFIALFVFLAFEVFHVRVEQLVLIVVIFSRLWPKFQALQGNWEQIAQSVPAFRSLEELQRECAAARESRPDDRLSVEPYRMKHGIECRGVRFRYEAGSDEFALRDVNLTIPANRMTAVIGHSGAGKTTLIDLLMGLIRPEKGEILVDGRPLEGRFLFSFRRAVSYVPQDPFLFHASIRDNLRIAAPDASEDDMWEALRLSASEEFVRGLPLGLDTVVGDRGVRLSGGERQRIVLARALLRKPALLILDEATSALDAVNEDKIRQALDRLKGEMTIIVIAHRLSTIRNADHVIVLERGRVVRQEHAPGPAGTFRYGAEMPSPDPSIPDHVPAFHMPVAEKEANGAG